ncbi:MAG: glycosyltransferase family 2 protein [Bdellovibrionales bacterium]
MPVVSIIIAAYNCKATIGRAIESAQCQTLGDIEIIIADDASTDGTYEFVQSLAAADPRIRALKLPNNGGPAAARNAAMAAAAGDWVAVLDADDWYEPGRLEAMHRAALEMKADLVCDNLKIYDHARDEVVEETRHGSAGRLTELTSEYLSRRDTPLSRHAIGYIKPMTRRQFMIAHNIAYNLQFRAGEDFIFLQEILLNGGRGILVPQACYVYVHRISPTTRKISPHSRSEAGFGLSLRGCDFLMQKYKASMPPAAREGLVYKRGVFESRIACSQMLAELRHGKLVNAVLIALKHPFIFMLMATTVTKLIYANMLFYRNRLVKPGGND